MRKKRIFLIVILGVAAVLAAVAVWQRDNISAAIKSVSYSEEEIDRMLEENKKKLEEEISEKYPDAVAVLSPEEEEMIVSGEMTPEEVVEKKLAELEKKQTESKKNETKSENSKQNEKSEENKKSNEAVNKKIIEFYSLKAYYLGRLSQIEAGVKADYASLPDEKKNLVGKQELVSKYMSTAVSLMNQCDSKVSALLSELESEIKANGGDLSVVSTIKSAYENEKNLKKAYYMSKLK